MSDQAPEPVIGVSSTDMTLALGAELFLREHHDSAHYVSPDPDGEQCFVTFVDIVVNSNTCFLTMPSGEVYGSNPLLVERLKQQLQRLPQGARVALSRETEDRIFEGFTSILTSDFARDWLGRWLRSQFLNPVVNAHHHARLGDSARNFIAISDEGREIWLERIARTNPMIQERMTPFFPMPMDLYDRDVDRAGGVVNFQCCYAFDVYRRGWQYAEATRQTGGDIKYCPHVLRRAALDHGSPDWLEFARDFYWSWGRFLAHLVRERRPEPEQVAEWILGIIAAQTPKWMRLPPEDQDTDSDKKQIRELIGQVEAVAGAANLPMSQVRPMGLLGFAEIPLEHLREQIELGTICKILQRLGVAKVVDSIGARLVESAKQAINIYYQKGTFAYPSLIGERLENRAAAKPEPTYLL